MRSFDLKKPTPRQFGFFVGILGAYGAVSYGFKFVAGTGMLRLGAGYGLAMSLLFVAASIGLWKSTPQGWWLGWMAMLSASLCGFVMQGPAGWPPNQFPPSFFPPFFIEGFMLAAAGIFFGMLAHRDIYGPCFASTSLPHSVFGAAPALLVIAGAAVLIIAGGVGYLVGPFLIVAMFRKAPWQLRPLAALLSGRKEWHAE
jgi:hypothetical protein